MVCSFPQLCAKNCPSPLPLLFLISPFVSLPAAFCFQANPSQPGAQSRARTRAQLTGFTPACHAGSEPKCCKTNHAHSVVFSTRKTPADVFSHLKAALCLQKSGLQNMNILFCFVFFSVSGGFLLRKFDVLRQPKKIPCNSVAQSHTGCQIAMNQRGQFMS